MLAVLYEKLNSGEDGMRFGVKPTSKGGQTKKRTGGRDALVVRPVRPPTWMLFMFANMHQLLTNMTAVFLQDFFKNTITIWWISELGMESFENIDKLIKKDPQQHIRLASFGQAAGIDVGKEEVCFFHVCQHDNHVHKPHTRSC